MGSEYRALARQLSNAKNFISKFEELAIAMNQEDKVVVPYDLTRLMEAPLLSQLLQRLMARDPDARATFAEALTLKYFDGMAEAAEEQRKLKGQKATQTKQAGRGCCS